MSCRQSSLLLRNISLHLIDIIFLLYPYTRHFYIFPSLMTGPAVLAGLGETEVRPDQSVTSRTRVIQSYRLQKLKKKSHKKSLGEAGLSALLVKNSYNVRKISKLHCVRTHKRFKQIQESCKPYLGNNFYAFPHEIFCT